MPTFYHAPHERGKQLEARRQVGVVGADDAAGEVPSVHYGVAVAGGVVGVRVGLNVAVAAGGLVGAAVGDFVAVAATGIVGTTVGRPSPGAGGAALVGVVVAGNVVVGVSAAVALAGAVGKAVAGGGATVDVVLGEGVPAGTVVVIVTVVVTVGVTAVVGMRGGGPTEIVVGSRVGVGSALSTVCVAVGIGFGDWIGVLVTVDVGVDAPAWRRGRSLGSTMIAAMPRQYREATPKNRTTRIVCRAVGWLAIWRYHCQKRLTVDTSGG